MRSPCHCGKKVTLKPPEFVANVSHCQRESASTSVQKSEWDIIVNTYMNSLTISLNDGVVNSNGRSRHQPKPCLHMMVLVCEMLTVDGLSGTKASAFSWPENMTATLSFYNFSNGHVWKLEPKNHRRCGSVCVSFG